MEDRNLSKALDIISALINGEEISRDSKVSSDLYDEYTSNGEVFDFCEDNDNKGQLAIVVTQMDDKNTDKK